MTDIYTLARQKKAILASLRAEASSHFMGKRKLGSRGLRSDCWALQKEGEEDRGSRAIGATVVLHRSCYESWNYNLNEFIELDVFVVVPVEFLINLFDIILLHVDVESLHDSLQFSGINFSCVFPVKYGKCFFELTECVFIELFLLWFLLLGKLLSCRN